MTQENKGTVLTDFQPLDKIGEGSYSSVYKVKRIVDDKIYALKKVKLARLSEKDINNSLNQTRILASIESSFIVQYKEAFYDDQAHALCIVMEWADGGDLQKMIQKQETLDIRLINEEEIWKAAAQILSGLQLLHSRGILHRDLKTANIFISKGMYKIGDMNVSKVQSQHKQMAYTQTGTPYYASPEVWKDQPYDARSDIWSFGCILYQMCTLHPPFQGKDIETLYKKIKKGTYQKISESYSSDLSEFISSCLHQNPKSRPTASNLLNGKSAMFDKKCHQYGINLVRQNTFKLLKTITYKGRQDDFSAQLPHPRYQPRLVIKNKTEETLEKSSSDHLSRKFDSQKTQKSARVLKKDTKLNRIKKCQEKLNKIHSAFKLSEDKHSSSSSKGTEQFVSMKNINKKHQFPRLAERNLSQRQVGALVDLPHIYPKYSRPRNLTTERRQDTAQNQNESKQLDVIKQIRRRLDHQKTRVKKTGITSQGSHKVIPPYKKNMLGNRSKEEQQSKMMSYSSKQRESEGSAKALIKPKKGLSIPYLKNAILRADSASNKVESIARDQGLKKIHQLKKKSKNQPKVNI